jgi:general secretion pathway protein E
MSQVSEREELFRGSNHVLAVSDGGIATVPCHQWWAPWRTPQGEPAVARYDEIARPALQGKRALQIAFVDGRPDWLIKGLPLLGAGWALELIERATQRAKLRRGPLFDKPLPPAALRDELAALAAAEPPDPLLLGEALVRQAILHQATDLHLAPVRDELVALFRLDGQLTEMARLPLGVGQRTLNSLKSAAGMPVYVATHPQTGRLDVPLSGRDVDVRLTSLPTAEGEKLAARLFDPATRPHDLAALGMEPEVLTAYQDLISRPQGCVLLTGPAGAGKSTTMYASLLALKIQSAWRHIATVEEPVEFIVRDIQQTEVSRERGLDFAEVLRVILRQDPQVIMVGEIRDRETAETAIQAGLTGHLIFSTVHAPDPTGVFVRLLDLEVAPYLVASAVSAVIAQRLVRTLCPHCAQPHSPTTQELQRAGLDAAQAAATSFRRAVGCEQCREGYAGRTGLFSLLVVNEALRRAVMERRPAYELSQQAALLPAGGLWEAGLRKAARGEVSLDELIRTLGPRA